jgi:N-glycosylase/DNA lyase
MITIENSDFSINQIAKSGQCFRINKLKNDIWQVIAFGKVLEIQQFKQYTHIFHCPSNEYKDIWVNYFDLKRDYSKIKESILKTNDFYLTKAVNYGYGLHILKQDLWEVIVSFIISQRNNIPRIKSTIEKLCIPYDNFFPSANDLINYTEIDFKSIGLGYRAKFLVDLIRAVTDGNFDIEYLKKLTDYQDAIKYLKQFNGIGDKIANCIVLFGLHNLEAFPTDVWIKRIIEKEYNGKFNIKVFKKYAGVVQQYMFFYQRSLK